MRRLSRLAWSVPVWLLAWGAPLHAKPRAEGPRPQVTSSAAAPAAPKADAREPADGLEWLDTPERAPREQQGRGSAFGFFAGSSTVLALAAAGLWWLRRGYPGSLSKVGQERIELLAVRSLGGQKRLILLETLGERMLIAVGDSDTTLITHLPGGQLPTAAEGDGELPAAEAEKAAAEVTRAVAEPQVPMPPAEPLAARSPTAPPAPAAPSAPPWRPHAADVFAAAPQPGRSEGDLAGLSRWRNEARAAGHGTQP